MTSMVWRVNNLIPLYSLSYLYFLRSKDVLNFDSRFGWVLPNIKSEGILLIYYMNFKFMFMIWNPLCVKKKWKQHIIKSVSSRETFYKSKVKITLLWFTKSISKLRGPHHHLELNQFFSLNIIVYKLSFRLLSHEMVIWYILVSVYYVIKHEKTFGITMKTKIRNIKSN